MLDLRLTKVLLKAAPFLLLALMFSLYQIQFKENQDIWLHFNKADNISFHSCFHVAGHYYACISLFDIFVNDVKREKTLGFSLFSCVLYIIHPQYKFKVYNLLLLIYNLLPRIL